MISVGLLLSASLALASGGAEPPLSPEAAKVVNILDALKANERRPSSAAGAGAEQTFEVSEGEINAYLAYRIAREPKGVRSATVRLREGKLIEVELVASLDPQLLDSLDAQALGWVRRVLLPLTRAENRIRVVGFFTSARGKGFYQTRSVELNGHAVPDSWVEEAMDLIGPRIKPPLDFHRLFDLSHGVEKGEVLPGRVRLRVRGP